jgi:hypothetical protein
MGATRCYQEHVLSKRPYIQPNWCEPVVRAPLHSEAQPDGRIRFWGAVIAIHAMERPDICAW